MLSLVKLGLGLIGGVCLMGVSMVSQAVPFTGAPNPALSPTFGTLVDFDDQAAGTVVGATDYMALGIASITETTGSGNSFQRYSGTQSQPNYIGTGFGYDLGGSDLGGWDGVFLFEFSSLADMVGIGIADSRGDAEVLKIYDSSMGVLESFTATAGANTYFGFDHSGVYDIKYLEVTCDFCALDDLQFTSSSVPEPASLTLLGMGLLGAYGLRKKAIANVA